MSSSEYVEYLKKEGFTSSEIMMAVSIKCEGITMTKALYKFNELYNMGEIDGFPSSSIEVLESIYGYKKLKSMKPNTLIQKVERLQSTLTSNVDEEIVKETVLEYLA